MDPYFSFLKEEDDRAVDPETLEGLVLGSLVEKYNLSALWSYEGFVWGSSDTNGTFNGVIGRVWRSELISS